MLILLSLFGRFFGNDRTVYAFTLGFTLIGAVYDLLRSLPDSLQQTLHLPAVLQCVGSLLPLSAFGLGWICPAAVGLAVGITVRLLRRGRGRKEEKTV